MAPSLTIFFSLLGGVLPALLWLWFWLREDSKRPEPRGRIASAFIFGMLAVIIVLPIERFVFDALGPQIKVETLALWAVIEELMKFLAAYWAALRLREADEPIDFIIYMVTTALGFSALENSFFLANFLDEGLLTQSIIHSNMRFLGATLLHTLTSATLGAFMALGFYKSPSTKKLALVAGILFATGLHTFFNFFIINLGERIFFVFGAVWVSIMILILMFEKIKSLKPEQNTP